MCASLHKEELLGATEHEINSVLINQITANLYCYG